MLHLKKNLSQILDISHDDRKILSYEPICKLIYKHGLSFINELDSKLLKSKYKHETIEQILKRIDRRLNISPAVLPVIEESNLESSKELSSIVRSEGINSKLSASNMSDNPIESSINEDKSQYKQALSNLDEKSIKKIQFLMNSACQILMSNPGLLKQIRLEEKSDDLQCTEIPADKPLGSSLFVINTCQESIKKELDNNKSVISDFGLFSKQSNNLPVSDSSKVKQENASDEKIKDDEKTTIRL